MAAPAEVSVQFVNALNEKFGDSGKVFDVQPGRKYDRVVQSFGGGGYSAHAFVERDSGKLLKAGGWASPQKDKDGPAYRFDLNSDFEHVVEVADQYGSYLYAR